jgi:hypothetical protein
MNFRDFLIKEISEALYRGAKNEYEIELGRKIDDKREQDPDVVEFLSELRRESYDLALRVDKELDKLSINTPDDAEKKQSEIQQVTEELHKTMMKELKEKIMPGK